MSQVEKFEKLLRRAAILGAEVRVVPMINNSFGDVEFYAHIQDHNSDTVDVALSAAPLDWVPLVGAASGLRGEPARLLCEQLGRLD